MFVMTGSHFVKLRESMVAEEKEGGCEKGREIYYKSRDMENGRRIKLKVGVWWKATSCHLSACSCLAPWIYREYFIIIIGIKLTLSM